MGKRIIGVILLAAMFVSLFGCGKEKEKNPSVTVTPTDAITASATPTGTPTPSPVPVNPLDSMTLRERYKDSFKVGVALPNSIISIPRYTDIVKEEFSSFTFENEMKPDALLDKAATQNGYPDTNTEPVLRFTSLKRGLDFAQENGIQLRGHTLLWYKQTPKWFFTVDYREGSELCSREVMIARLESYIRQVMEYFQTEYPGLIYAWDVVNEAVDGQTGDENMIRKGSNLWYSTIGPDFIQYAFRFTRKYSDGTAKLYYNDFNCAQKKFGIVKVLEPILAEGNIDGIGMQCHLSSGNSVREDVYKTAKYFASQGYCIEITELDIGQTLKGEDGDKIQAMKYKILFQLMEEAKKNGEINIDSITVWGLYDTVSWRATERPLLYRIAVGGLEKKPAWYGAMQDPDIPAMEW